MLEDSTGSSVLSDKVKRALEVRTDTPAMKAALEALSHLPSESMDSRSVRVAIEQDALEQAMLLQEELRGLVNIVSDLRQGVSETARIAQLVSEAIQTNVIHIRDEAKSDPTMPDVLPLSSSDALGKEEQLAALLAGAFQERQDAEQRAKTVSAFLEKFDLSEEDSILLESYNFEDMEEEHNDGMSFLDALERVKTIRTELTSTFGSSVPDLLGESSLGGSGSGQDRLGATSAIRMMESLAIKQERAYERLYHWLQKYLHLNSVTHVPTSSGTSPQMVEIDSDILDEALSHPFVRRSLEVLHHVPAFYSHTLELIASSRRAEETRRFLLALTSGYHGRAPIEMKAHDPVNYVGDMLAFCFQSCSVEADVAKGLVVNSEDEEEGSSTMSASDMLSHAMSGLARPLKSRVLQVVASLARRPDEEGEDDDGQPLDDEEEDAIARSRISALYGICGLLLFYRSAIDKAVMRLDASTTENPLVVAIVECLTEASQAYMASLKVYAAMLESLSLLSGTSEAGLSKSMMDVISNNRTTSPGFTEDVFCPPQFVTCLGMEFVAETLLEAALSLCKNLDDAVTLKLSLTHAKKAGLSTTVASLLDGKISQTEQVLIQDLVKSETQEVLELCGLATLIKVWKNMPPVDGIVMAAQPGLTADDMDLGLKEFYASLYSPPLPAFENIRDPVLRKIARNRIASNVVDAYEELYNAIRSERGGYDDLSFLGHTPEQVKTLFSV